MRVLVLAAHPDDEVLGCGGTIARFAQEGHEVIVAILGEGITSRYARREDADETLLVTLRKRSQAVADLLGVKQLQMFDLPDNRFDTIPLLDVIKIVEELVDRFKPELVYTQHGGDLNIDHVVLFRAALTATRPTPDNTVREVYAYEVASSSEWAFQQFTPRFTPNVFVDIAGTLGIKVAAMELYESEARSFPHPRSAEALRAGAVSCGAAVGLRAAEAFTLVRSVRRDPASHLPR